MLGNHATAFNRAIEKMEWGEPGSGAEDLIATIPLHPDLSLGRHHDGKGPREIGRFLREEDPEELIYLAEKSLDILKSVASVLEDPDRRDRAIVLIEEIEDELEGRSKKN